MGGGASEVYPCKKGAENVLAMLRGTTSFEVVLTRELEVLAILIRGGGGAKDFHPLNGEGGGGKWLPCLKGGHKRFWTHDFPIL